MKMPNLPAFASLAFAALAAGCGGGESSATVQTLSAGNLQYSRTMTVNVAGRDMGTDVYMTADDDTCDNIVKTAASTPDATVFTCRVKAVGDIKLRVRAGVDGNILASLGVEVPMPQVTMVATQNTPSGTATGTVVYELDPVKAPLTVMNFLAYVNAGFYAPSATSNAGVIFHRVINDVLVQAGGYQRNQVVKNPTRAAVPLENTGLLNLRGAIAMWHPNGPDTATAQFFVNTKDNPQFDVGSAENPEGFAVFGRVITGMEHIDRLKTVPTENKSALLPNVPVTQVQITSMTQTK